MSDKFSEFLCDVYEEQPKQWYDKNVEYDNLLEKILEFAVQIKKDAFNSPVELTQKMRAEANEALTGLVMKLIESKS